MTEKLKMEQNPLSATVERIKEICPAAVTSEGKIDFEELKTALSDDVAADAIESMNLHGLVKIRPRPRQIVQFVKPCVRSWRIPRIGIQQKICISKVTTWMH